MRPVDLNLISADVGRKCHLTIEEWKERHKMTCSIEEVGGHRVFAGEWVKADLSESVADNVSSGLWFQQRSVLRGKNVESREHCVSEACPFGR